MAGSAVDCDLSEQECRALVERILASKEFQRANRLRSFLLYVVDRKFADAPQDVSESVIGHRVFGRPASYNTGEDSIVRTEARILRQRLDRYFAAEGAAESILLEMPKGSYLPVFARREIKVEQTVTPLPPPKRLFTPAIWLAIGIGAAAVVAAWQLSIARSVSEKTVTPAVTAEIGSVELQSSDPRLVRSFHWAKDRALEYAHSGDARGSPRSAAKKSRLAEG